MNVMQDASGPTRAYEYPVGHEHRLLDTVCDDNGGLAKFPLLCGEVLVEPLAKQLVQRVKRLVKEQDLWTGDISASNRCPLPHTPGELMRVCVPARRELGDSEDFLDRIVIANPCQIQRQADVLLDSPVG
jgi:hypothetical protein